MIPYIMPLKDILMFRIPYLINEILTYEELENHSQIVEEFYNSKLYQNLTQENSRLWRMSDIALYDIFQLERETGEVRNPWMP